MAASPEHGGRRGVLLAAAVTAVLAVLGSTLLALGLGAAGGPGSIASPPSTTSVPDDRQVDRGGHDDRSPGDDRGSAPSRATASKDDARRDPPTFGSFLPNSRPVGLKIPSIQVDSANIVDLGLQEDGSIEVPRNADHPGWFSPGPSPGQLGPAVIAGHVDSETGPAVFYRLAELRAGDRVEVVRADGTTARFVIDRVATFEKDEFPTREVYGAIDHAGLRLITCSGDYDEKTGYDSNTVAFARLVR